MIKIELNQNSFKINNIVLEFPISVTQLNSILGESRLTVKPKNTIFTWDEAGITGYTKNLETIDSLIVEYAKKNYDFSPKSNFEGELLFNNYEIINFRKNHPDKLIMLFKDDFGGALLSNGIRCWFETEKSNVEAIEIKPFDGKFYQNPIKKERETPLVVEDKFAYLIPLWENWKNAVTNIVPVDNKYYNLKYGITHQESEMYKTLEEDIEIPEELIAFYKIYNVSSNPITSAFNISGFDWDFDLLPFSYIKAEWENIQDMQFGDSLEEENLEEFSEKVKADDYANPRWIPFAEGKNGDYLLYDTDPSELGTYGQIIELQNESWTREVIASSLSELIEKEIDNIQKGDTKKYNFILDIDEVSDSDSDAEDVIDEEIKQFYDDEIKNILQIEVKKGLYDIDEIIERVLEQYEDEDDFETLKKIALKDCIAWKNELAESIKNNNFSDVAKLQNALQILATQHNIISPTVIGYTQDEAIHEAETELDKKGGIGFVYFTEQDIERTIDEKYIFYLGFNCAQRNSDTNFSKGIAIGKTIVLELENQGFEVDWGGTMETRIGIKNFQWICLNYYSNINATDNVLESELEQTFLTENNKNSSANYDFNLENLKKVINSNKVPSNSSGLNFSINGVDVVIKKPYIDTDGNTTGNAIFIDSNSGLQLYFSINNEYVTRLYRINEDGAFETLDQNTIQSVHNFANSIWGKIIDEINKTDIEPIDAENGLSLQKFKNQFGKYAIPNDLLKLFHFGEEHGHYDFSQSFYLNCIDKTGLKTYANDGVFLNAFIEFACANGSGSTYGFWVLNEDLNQCPIVVFGDEGGMYIIAENLQQLFHLLSFDCEPTVSYDEVYFYLYDEDEDYEHSEKHEEYVQWLMHNFGLQPITKDEQTNPIIKNAQEKYQKKLNDFIAQFKVEEIDYNLLNIAPIQLVPFAQVKHFIPTDSWIAKIYENQDAEHQNVLFIDGDWTIENIDLADPFSRISDNKNQIERFNETAKLFVINGNLKAKNIYSSNDDGAFGLLVTGNLEAENMVVGGSDIYIKKDLKIKDLFWGNYNHGSLTVDGMVSARIFINSSEYLFDYIPSKMEVEMYLEDPEIADDKEMIVKMADKLFAIHLLEFDIYNIYDDDFEDVNSWTDIVDRKSLINVLKIGDSVFNSEFTDSIHSIEEDIIPKLFQNTTFKNKEDFNLQFDNFQKVLHFFKDEEGGPRYYFKLPEINASVMIMKEDGTKQKISDGSKVALQSMIMVDIHKDSDYFSAGEEFMIWRQKEETGLKTFFKKPKYDYTNKDGSSMFVFLYRDTDKSVFKYRLAFEMCKVEALQKIWDLVLEAIEKGIFYKNKFENEVKNTDVSSLLHLPMVLEKYPNSWNDSDECPWFGNTCYSFCQGSPDLIPSISIIKEIDNINNDFDAKSFYFRLNNKGDNARLDFKANYHELNDALYEMHYSRESARVPFYHYPLYQEAIKLWKKALVVLPKENEKYASKKRGENQVEFSITEAQYRNYYQEKPISENKLAELTYENFKNLANYCETLDRSYSYDFFVIIRDYHWVSVKLTQEWSLHSVTQKKAVKFIFLDEPYGNDTNNENYAELKYHVEIDENNYLSFSSNAVTDDEAEKTIQFMLFQLLKKVKKIAPYFILPNNVEAAQDELNTTIEKKQIKVFESCFVQSKKDKGNFWNNGIWDKNYFYSFQVWEENNLDIRISWTHPEKAQLEDLRNNMQVVTIRFNKISKQITYYFQPTFENNMVFENFEFDLKLMKKLIIGYHFMLQKVKSESKQLKEIEKEKNKRANYSVTKPYGKVEIDGIFFTLKNRVEATEILNQCVDFDNNTVYDPFYIHYIETEDEKSFFLVAEDVVEAEKLDLETYPAHHEEINILGFIFLKKLTLTKYAEAEDLEFSPPLICMDDAEITSVLLTGNTHYFHKNLKCINLHGEYNHGSLIVKGKTDANFIFADDFNMKFNQLSAVVSCSDDRDIEIMNDLSKLDLSIDYELNYLPGMFHLQHCLQDRFIYLDDKYGYRIKDEGYRSGKSHYTEGQETFFEALRNGERVLDYQKLENNRNLFTTNAFSIAKDLFTKHSNLKDLAIGEVYYLFPNPDNNHINFYFQQTNDYYFIGYWNIGYHLSVSIGLHKSGNQNKHELTVFYWNNENTETCYSYTVLITDVTYYNNICQKVFIEAVEGMSLNKLFYNR